MTKRRSISRPRKSTKTVAPRKGWALIRLWIIYICLAVMVVMSFWALYLDSVVRKKFEGKKWALPAHVYAQPLELYQGMELSSSALEQELQALGYRFGSAATAPGQVSKSSSFSGSSYRINSRGFEFWDKREPAQKFQLELSGTQVTALRDQAGADIPLVRLEPEEIGGFYPADKEDRILVRLSDLPPLLGETLLAVEDKHFLEHHGVSPLAIIRAAWINMRSGNVRQGGSTITQQLVKNFYLSNEQSLFHRKIPEAMMALLLELHYSKSEILETYINEVFLGQAGNRAIHGFALASQHYFRQPLQELNTQEVALLVGLVKGASYYNPWRHPERAKERRNVVLGVMKDEGLITEPQMKAAQAAPLGVVAEGQAGITTFPAFMDLVKRQLSESYAEEDLRTEGLRIFTTLSPSVQRRAEQALQNRVAQLAKGYKVPDLQGGLIVSSVGSGEILALVGDRDPRFNGFNRALDAKRQVGSLMKPFVYLSALEIPQKYNLGSIISDDPVSYKSGGEWWAPQNADKQNHGDVPLYIGLAHSYNQATARLGMTLGLSRVIKTLRAAGYSGDVPEVPAILLGSVEMSPFEVSEVYHTIAADGVYTPLHAIREVLTADGKPLKRYPLELEQRFAPESIFQLQFAMQKVMREGTARSAYLQLPSDLMLAGKTGTTNDQRDSWFAGFSGEHLAVAWVGRDNNQQTPFSGATGALQVWTDLFKQLPTRSLETEPPAGISMEWLDSKTGKLSAEGCENAVELPVREDFKPLDTSDCVSESPLQNWWQKLVN